MILFKTPAQDFTDDDLAHALEAFDLTNKNVLLYSSLISLGRITERKAVDRVIDMFQEAVGADGTLSIPAYSFSAYNKQVFDIENSRSIVGIVSEVARSRADFKRTFHPVYSNACWGKLADMLSEQNPATCFGKGSFFDLFASVPDSQVIMFGISFNAATLCHYYDQLFQAPGRFVKRFECQVKKGDEIVDMEFDSYVRDHDFYGDRMSSAVRFDALATELGLIQRSPFAANWIHRIGERDFRLLYKASLDVDQEYFIMADRSTWEEYALKNNFSMLHNRLDPEKVSEAKSVYEKLAGGN